MRRFSTEVPAGFEGTTGIMGEMSIMKVINQTMRQTDLGLQRRSIKMAPFSDCFKIFEKGESTGKRIKILNLWR